jgi:hypothetical protein
MCVCSTHCTTVHHYLPVFSLQSVKLKSQPHKSPGTSAAAVSLQHEGEVLQPNKITRRTKIQLPSNARTVSITINVIKLRNLNCY